MNGRISEPPVVSQLDTIGFVDVIIPTIGRADSLCRLLDSLANQSRLPDQIVIADGSADGKISQMLQETDWAANQLLVRRITVDPPNAVRQRCAAIAATYGEFLLLLDDDVVLEPDCLKEMLTAMSTEPDVVAVTADFNNQQWSQPTTLWRWYLRLWFGLCDGEWNGRVIGPLLRFGYCPSPSQPSPMEWFGAGNTLIRRSAYEQAGGFSRFFLHRCTTNEDVDLGLKVGRVGRILLNPAARMAHLHAPSGRVTAGVAAEDDLYNRFQVLRLTQQRSICCAFGLIVLYFSIETLSSLAGCIRRQRWNGFGERLCGRLRALGWIIFKRPSLPDVDK
jgi:GT2 family glycosyltransferase